MTRKTPKSILPTVPGFNSELAERKKKSVPPSYFVRNTRTYLKWSSVNFCPLCGLRGKYEDLHDGDPCPECGELDIQEHVGKWVNDYWLLKGEDEAEVPPTVDQGLETKEPLKGRNFDLASEADYGRPTLRDTEQRSNPRSEEGKGVLTLVVIAYAVGFLSGVLASIST